MYYTLTSFPVIMKPLPLHVPNAPQLRKRAVLWVQGSSQLHWPTDALQRDVACHQQLSDPRLEEWGCISSVLARCSRFPLHTTTYNVRLGLEPIGSLKVLVPEPVNCLPSC